jgi:hypothetical protein
MEFDTNATERARRLRMLNEDLQGASRLLDNSPQSENLRIVSQIIDELVDGRNASAHRLEKVEGQMAQLGDEFKRLNQRVYGDTQMGVQGVADLVHSVQLLTVQLNSVEHSLRRFDWRFNALIGMGVVLGVLLGLYLFLNLMVGLW